MASACLGVAEVFKRLISLKECRGNLLDDFDFSLYSYKSGERDPGPDLPKDIPIHLLLCGVGAIGNGIIYLLKSLPVSGHISIVDSQKYQKENLGTCFLIGKDELDKEKSDFAEEFLRTKLDAKGYFEDVLSFKSRLGKEIHFPNIVLNGLDNIDARHEVQNIWPDIIIDGAISDFGCQVSRHPWSEDTACLRCLFQKKSGESAVEVGSIATGLSRDRISNPEEPVTELDIENAPEEKRSWLRGQLGKPICSVVKEGVAKQISQRDLDAKFEPSVPFVACFSASMVVGELVKYVAGWSSPLEPRFQFDILRGPAFGQEFPEERRKDCVCNTRKHNIEIIRNRRSEQL